MTALKPRVRLIRFRLSEEEYQAVNRLCISEGARSLSDFVRSALQNSTGKSFDSPETAIDAELRTVRQRVEQLSDSVMELTLLIEEASPEASPEGDRAAEHSEVSARSKDN
jgi:hypothetical protein